MALKDKWRDRIDGVDPISADDINQVANAVIEIEEKEPEIGTGAIEGALNFNGWHSNDFSKALYNFKLFKYDATQKNLNADVSVRLRVVSRSSTSIYDFFRYTFSLKRPFVGTEKSRIQFIPQRIIQEGKSTGFVLYFRAYEKAVSGSSTERELWLEVNTAVNFMVDEVYFSVMKYSGEITEAQIKAKPNNYYSLVEGYDSLTAYSKDWGNKTAVLSLDSRATAEGAVVSGTGNRVEAVDADGGGTGNTVKGTASIVRGANNKENGKYNIVGGNGNKVSGSSNIVGGGGGKSEVTGGYDLAVGYDQYVTGEGSANVGHYNRIIHKQAQTFGRYLATGRHYQARFGVGAERDADGNGKDKTSMLVVSNGAENGSNGVDIFAVSNAYSGDAENGYYAKASKPNDAITLGYFNSTLKQSVVDAVIDAIPRAEGVGF